jgi:hypothetical protein
MGRYCQHQVAGKIEVLNVHALTVGQPFTPMGWYVNQRSNLTTFQRPILTRGLG